MPPLPRFCVYLCKYMFECIEKLDFDFDYKFGKGQFSFDPIKLSRFAEKIEFGIWKIIPRQVIYKKMEP